MAMRARDRWEAAFHRLRLTLLGDLDATDILDRSRERIRDARDALERTALQSRHQPFVGSASSPISEADGDGSSYFALILDDHGMVSKHKLLACDDLLRLGARPNERPRLAGADGI